MKNSNSALIHKASEILMSSGVENLTISNLAREMGVHENTLPNDLTKDQDIILLVLFAFETDLNELISEMKSKKVNPETEIKLLFKGLYFLFLQKPFYLSLLFDKNLAVWDEDVKKAILRIKQYAENYLLEIINDGKNKRIFHSKVPSALLVRKILNGFRVYMKDEQRLNDMLREYKTLITDKD